MGGDFSEEALAFADVNNDGVVNVSDIVSIVDNIIGGN